MAKRKRSKSIFIRRSCLTGNAVWIYRGEADNERKTYWKACRFEVERVQRWTDIVSRRMGNISRLISDCLVNIPLNVELTPQQKQAVRQLQSVGNKGIICHRDFYEHIMAQRKQRQIDNELRRRVKEREKSDNVCYDK